MAQAKDYGDQDSTTLVPAGLTVFRHFMMDMQDGRLYPMNMVPSRSGYPFSGMASNRAYNVAPQAWTIDGPKPGPLVHEAECAKINRFYQYGYSTEPAPDEEVMHQVPVVSCSCGFYAHYDPGEDFYPDRSWGYNISIANGHNELRYHVIVRAVCEASGRVVMGRLGVRAAKLRILGIAIDWDKQQKVPYIGDAFDYTPNAVTGLDWRLDPSSGMARYVRDNHGSYLHSGSGGPAFERGEDEQTIYAAEHVARAYDCRLYGSVKEMHEAHPKEDVEALGVDTTPPAPTLNHFFRQQVMLYANAPTTMQGQAMQRSIIDELFSKPKAEKRRPKKVESAAKTAFEKALAAKKGRAAAPGSGIDYRKRRI